MIIIICLLLLVIYQRLNIENNEEEYYCGGVVFLNSNGHLSILYSKQKYDYDGGHKGIGKWEIKKNLYMRLDNNGNSIHGPISLNNNIEYYSWGRRLIADSNNNIHFVSLKGGNYYSKIDENGKYTIENKELPIKIPNYDRLVVIRMIELSNKDIAYLIKRERGNEFYFYKIDEFGNEKTNLTYLFKHSEFEGHNSAERYFLKKDQFENIHFLLQYYNLPEHLPRYTYYYAKIDGDGAVISDFKNYTNSIKRKEIVIPYRDENLTMSYILQVNEDLYFSTQMEFRRLLIDTYEIINCLLKEDEWITYTKVNATGAMILKKRLLNISSTDTTIFGYCIDTNNNIHLFLNQGEHFDVMRMYYMKIDNTGNILINKKRIID